MGVPFGSGSVRLLLDKNSISPDGAGEIFSGNV